MFFSAFDRLAKRAIRLGDEQIVMPIDEMRLSSQFAALPGQDRIVTRLLGELFLHENMHVRRIAVNAVRRSGCFTVEGLDEALLARLSDSEAWVRYDAAWAIAEARFDTPTIRQALLTNAGDARLPEDENKLKANPSNAELQAKVRARKTLDALASESD